MPVTAWSRWQAADGDPAPELRLATALVPLRARLAGRARARGTAIGTDTDGLLDLIADTPASGHFRYRLAWPLELWWMASAGAGRPATWKQYDQGWRQRHPLVQTLGVTPLRRYGTRGPSRLSGLPLVVPSGASAADVPGLLAALADAARTTPSGFASTSQLESTVLGGHGESLLLRLVIRSVQVLIGDRVRARNGQLAFDPEPLIRPSTAAGRLEGLITSAEPATADPGTRPTRPGPPSISRPSRTHCRRWARSRSTNWSGCSGPRSTVRVTGWIPGCWRSPSGDWMLASLQVPDPSLGAYGWAEAPAPGTPGPTPAGVIHAPTAPAAMTAAILRDRAISDPSPRWDLAIDSRTARAAERIAGEVRAGAHLYEVMGREVERVVGRPDQIQTLRQTFPIRTEHAGRRTCDGMKVLAAEPFPIPVDADQDTALAVLREALGCYADLLVADAVHYLVEGRAETAGQVMDAAAGLSRPPELSLLRTARSGRAVSTSVLLALPHIAGPALPTAQAQRAVLSPATVLDPSMAAAVSAQIGNAAVWDFVIGPEVVGSDQPVTVTVGDLGLTPADALALTLSTLQRLAAEHAGRPDAEVVGGSGPALYEQAAVLVGLAGRNPAPERGFSENRSLLPPGAAADPEIVTRYTNTRSVGEALAAQLGQQVSLLGTGDALGSADAARIRALLRAASAWGIAPAAGMSPPASARTALDLLQGRLASAPDAAAAAQLSLEKLSAAAVALVSPTGQLGLTAAVPAPAIPRLTAAPSLDEEWLTIIAAVRPALARLESHQLGPVTRSRRGPTGPLIPGSPIRPTTERWWSSTRRTTSTWGRSRPAAWWPLSRSTAWTRWSRPPIRAAVPRSASARREPGHSRPSCSPSRRSRTSRWTRTSWSRSSARRARRPTRGWSDPSISTRSSWDSSPPACSPPTDRCRSRWRYTRDLRRHAAAGARPAPA